MKLRKCPIKQNNKTNRKKDGRNEKRINSVASNCTNRSSREREQRTLRGGNCQINNTGKFSILKFSGLYRVHWVHLRTKNKNRPTAVYVNLKCQYIWDKEDDNNNNNNKVTGKIFKISANVPMVWEFWMAIPWNAEKPDLQNSEGK